MLPIRIELFDVANENWAFNVANENWVLMLPMRNWALMLPIRIGLFDVASENWAFDVANENWTLDVANEKLDFDVANENWTLMLPIKNWALEEWDMCNGLIGPILGFAKRWRKKIGPNMWFLGFMVMVYIVTQFGNEIVNTCGLIWWWDEKYSCGLFECFGECINRVK